MAEKNTDFKDYKEEIPEIKEALANLEAAYDDLRENRTQYDLLDDNYYNTFSEQLNFDDKDANILRSGMCYSSVEIASRGMLFPTFRVETMDKTGKDAMNAAAVAKSLIEWAHRESGFINAFQESKEEWAKAGDGYRRPYLEDIGDGRFWPQYESLDPRNVLLDPECRLVWSKSVARSASYWGYTDIYDDLQLKRRFGRKVFEMAQPGSMIDHDNHAERMGKNTKNDRLYYEVIEYQNSADGVEMVLIGKNALPVKIEDEYKKHKVPAGLKGVLKTRKQYRHKDRGGKNELTLHNTYFYFDKRQSRNLGLVKRLAPIQHSDERIENLKMEAAQLKMFEIPTVAGGREDLVRGAIQEFVEERKENVFAVLHAPSNIEGVIPKFDVLRFQGVSAEDGQAATDDLYTLARNTVGLDMTRLQVQANITLGQSQLIEQEKLDTLETIILRNKEILEHEYEGLLNFVINNEGFDLNDVKISCDYYGDIEGASEGSKLDYEGKRSVSIVEAVDLVKDELMNVVIDDSSLVNRTYVALLDSWIKLLGVVNPEITPDLYKHIMTKVGEAGRFDIPEGVMDGVEKQQQAMGGASQFQSAASGGAAPQQPQPGAPGGAPQDAAADPVSQMLEAGGGMTPPMQ